MYQLWGFQLFHILTSIQYGYILNTGPSTTYVVLLDFSCIFDPPNI